MSDVGYAGTMADAPDDADGKTIDGTPADPKEPVEALPVSKLPPGQQFDALSGWLKVDMDASRPWRAEARHAFAFRAGDQWTEDDKALLATQERPVIVFNRVLTILKAVAGMEINGRHEIAFLPRNTEDTAPNEVLTGASKWMADSCDGEDEESEAFDHTCTCGMGWVEERMSYLADPAGMYIEESVDPLEMYWDRTAKKKNLKGARRLARVRRMPVADAMKMFKGFSRDQLDAVWAEGGELDYPEKSIEEKRRRDSDNVLSDYDDTCEVTIVQIQWIEIETYWLVADIATGQRSELTAEQYKSFKARMKQLGDMAGQAINVPAVEMTRECYKQAFLGATGVMLKKAGPSPIKGQFSWKCITGEFDKPKNCWFGLVRILRDPQMWANKWLSQILHILNSTAKGGIIAERDAFDDEREAEESFAQAERITWAASGALSGANPKIIQKIGTPMTEGYVGLLAFAISSFKDVSGINLELLGQQDQNQPGVLEAMRKQAGMTVLATLFDSLRRFRKQVGRGRLYFIQNFLSDDRMIRIAGNSVGQPAQVVRIAKDKTAGEYDVVVDDTPTSPNQKEANWAIIQPMLVTFREQLMANPPVLAMLLEYSPLPSRIVDAFKQFVTQSQNDPEQQKIKELAFAKDISEIEKNRSTANLNNAKAGGAQSTATYEMAMAHNLLSDNEREQKRHEIELLKEAAGARQAELDAHDKAAETQTRAFEAASAHRAENRKLDIAGVDAGSRRISALATAHKAAADSQHKRVGLLIDHLAATSSARRNDAAANKDHAVARREDRTPVAVPGASA